MATSSKKYINSLYKTAIQAQNQAYKVSKQQSENNLNQTLSAIDSNYRSNVTSAQTASRISALGNEEKLAAAGLSFGSAYDRATTGYTETSRVSESNNLRSNLNRLATVRTQSITDARNQYSSEVAEARRTKYENISSLRAQRAQATISYEQQRYENALTRWKTYGYVLPADAKVLGVKAGSKTASKEYNEAKLAIDRIKALK